MSDAWPIASRVLGVFLVVLLGALARKIGWLTSAADKSLASFTANALLPCLFFDRISQGVSTQAFSDVWVATALGFGCTCGGFCLAWLFAKSVGPLVGIEDESTQRVFALCVGIANYSYIPLPLAEHFYPNAVVPLLTHNVGVDLAMWTAGIVIITGESRGKIGRALLSPALLSWLVAVLVRSLGWREYIPGPIVQATHALGECFIPMGLILSGAIIFDHLGKAGRLLHWKLLASAVVLRMLIFPVIILSLAYWLPIGQEIKQVLMLQAAMPTATFPIVLAHLYGRNVGAAVWIVVTSSLIGLVTIPIWFVFGSWWLGFA